jgi:hypothetical protein
MTGTVNIARALWDDPTFRDSEMSQREAWIWLIAQASWRPRIKRIDSREIKLARAQVAASTRFLARAWKWSEPKVRRYLDMLENRRKIKRAIDAGVTVITICKYDKHQSKPRDGDAAPTQEPTQDRRTADANEDKGEIRIKEEEGACAREVSFAEKLRSAVGIDPTSPPSRYWQDEAMEPWVTRWRKVGLTDDQILAEAKASRSKNPEAPDGPKALNGWMMQAATNRTAASSPTPEVAKAQALPKLSKSPEQRLQDMADMINGDGYCAPSMVTNTMRDALLQAGLVTPERLRERQIY